MHREYSDVGDVLEQFDSDEGIRSESKNML